MKIDDAEVTRAEAAKLAELLGGKVEDRPIGWAKVIAGGKNSAVIQFPDGVVRDYNWWVEGFASDDANVVVLVANRLAAMNAKGPLESMICYSLHNRSDPGYEAKFGAETVFIARIERQDDFMAWIGKSPDLAEAVLGAAIRWTRAVMADEKESHDGN